MSTDIFRFLLFRLLIDPLEIGLSEGSDVPAWCDGFCSEDGVLVKGSGLEDLKGSGFAGGHSLRDGELVRIAKRDRAGP